MKLRWAKTSNVQVVFSAAGVRRLQGKGAINAEMIVKEADLPERISQIVHVSVIIPPVYSFIT